MVTSCIDHSTGFHFVLTINGAYSDVQDGTCQFQRRTEQVNEPQFFEPPTLAVRDCAIASQRAPRCLLMWTDTHTGVYNGYPRSAARLCIL